MDDKKQTAADLLVEALVEAGVPDTPELTQLVEEAAQQAEES
jgi:hypothetical protein